MYKILEPIMVRMPLYSHEEYKKIDLFADVDKFIQNFSNRPSFLKAIAISSPDFYTSVIENEKNVVYSDKYRDSMLKYISRATSRATPFGAFSLVSFGKLDRETSFVIHEEKRSTFLNLIDADLFWKIIRELEQNAQIYPYLKVRLNPNLHITTNRVKNPYISHLGQSNTKFFQANIRNTKQFEMIQKYARNPISVKDLVYSLYVYNNKKIEIAKIQKYVDSLIENEFLLSELRFFDVHEGLSKIISVCKKSCFDCEMIENLKRINKVFCRLNAQCDDKEWLNAYFNLYKLCNEQFSGKNITNTLLFAPQYEATLGKNVLASIYRLENFATKTALPDNETTAVSYWKKLFKEKYGPYVEINFLELFDDNSGFGDPYAPKNHISTNEVPNESYKKRYLKNLLERKIVLSLAKGDNKIVFSNEDIEQLDKISTGLAFLPSVDLGINIIANNKESFSNRDFTIQVMDNIGAKSAGAHLSRFREGMGDNINDAYIDLQKQKDKISNQRYTEVFAREIPQYCRTANIANPKTELKYSIDLGLVCADNSIPLNDLYIGYDRRYDRLYIRSKSLGTIIKVSIDGVLNAASSNHLIRLLREISYGYEIDPLSGIALFRESQYDYIPDIWYENILIQSAVWRVHTKDYSKKDFKKFVELFNSEKTLLGFTRYIYISDYDRKILIDTQNSGYMQLLYRHFKKNEKVAIQKCSQFEEKWCCNEIGQSMHAEFIIPLVQKSDKGCQFLTPLPRCMRENSIKYNVPFGEENYVYLKLYLDMEYADKFILNMISPFINRLDEDGILDKYFYIRYADPNFHIRLRLCAKNKALYNKLLLTVQEWVNRLYTEREIEKYEFAIYERETERYGGEECMPEIERLFFADSDLAIQVISQKSNLNESEMHTLCAWILAQTVLDLVSKDEIKNAIVSPRIDKDARRSYRMIRDDILSLINTQGAKYNNSNFEALFKSISERHRICLDLRAKFKQISMSNDLSDTVRSIIHMTSNRINGNPLWEKKITAYAMRTIESYSYLRNNY